MVQMITPWKHPQTGIYYLYKELPPHLRAEMGKRQVRRSLKTRDPAEAKRLFVMAHAELEREMAAAEERIAAQRKSDEISPERAKVIVDQFIRDRHASGTWARWPTLGLVFWLEDTARRVLDLQHPIAMLPLDDSPERLMAKRGEPLPGDCWLDAVRQYPPSEWLEASGIVLEDVFKEHAPSIVRIPSVPAYSGPAGRRRVRRGGRPGQRLHVSGLIPNHRALRHGRTQPSRRRPGCRAPAP